MVKKYANRNATNLPYDWESVFIIHNMPSFRMKLQIYAIKVSNSLQLDQTPSSSAYDLAVTCLQIAWNILLPNANRSIG